MSVSSPMAFRPRMAPPCGSRLAQRRVFSDEKSASAPPGPLRPPSRLLLVRGRLTFFLGKTPRFKTMGGRSLLPLPTQEDPLVVTVKFYLLINLLFKPFGS